MAKAVGTIKIALHAGPAEVPAYRIGKFWAVNQASDGSPYYSVTHINSGLRIMQYIHFRLACRYVGIFDALLPAETTEQVEKIWHSLPANVHKAIATANSEG